MVGKYASFPKRDFLWEGQLKLGTEIREGLISVRKRVSASTNVESFPRDEWIDDATIEVANIPLLEYI